MPVDSKDIAFRSVHYPGRCRISNDGTVIASNLPVGSGAVVIGASQAHLVHVSTLSGPGISPDIPPVIHGDRRRCGHRSRFPVAFRLLAFACWTIPCPPWTSASLTVDPPGMRMTARPTTGLPRSTRSRRDRGGCPLYPGTAVFTRPVGLLWPAPAASQRPVLHPGYTFHRRGPRDETSSGVHSRSPVRSSPHL